MLNIIKAKQDIQCIEKWRQLNISIYELGKFWIHMKFIHF